VFLHGLGWDHRLWLPALARYRDRYRAIAGDTRGHGGSDKPAGPYRIAQFAADWRAALTAIAATPCCLVGLSQGGMVAQQIAVDAPDLVAALVLVSTACRETADSAANMAERLAKMRAMGAAAGAEIAARAIFSPAFRAASPDYLANFLAERAAQPQEPLIAAMAAISGFDMRSGLAALDVPTLVVAGSADALTTPATVREVADHIPGAEYVEMEGPGHIIPVEQPGEFHALIDRFLEAHYPRQA
jgi:3-oxoadipate enol-lactonase